MPERISTFIPSSHELPDGKGHGRTHIDKSRLSKTTSLVGGKDDIYMDMSELENLTKLDGILNWETIALIIVRAMNHTGKKVFTAVKNDIYRNYNIKKRDINKFIKNRKANFNKFIFTIESRHNRETISFKYFGAKQAYTGRGKGKIRAGVKVKIKREFRGRTKSGKAKFVGSWRTYDKAFMLYGKYAYIRKGIGRSDIQLMTGPSVAQILSNPMIKTIALKKWARSFPARLSHEIDRALTSEIKKLMK